MVQMIKKCPELLSYNEAYARMKLDTFVDSFESFNLGDKSLAMKVFVSFPCVVVALSCERVCKRFARLNSEFTCSVRKVWPVDTWRLVVTRADSVVDRLLYCRQHDVSMAASRALGLSAARWREMFPEFEQWQQELEEARQRQQVEASAVLET
eukprot:jgi/Chlat1/325/Chrsp1S03069